MALVSPVPSGLGFYRSIGETRGVVHPDPNGTGLARRTNSALLFKRHKV
jgi:hypothetical protein